MRFKFLLINVLVCLSLAVFAEIPATFVVTGTVTDMQTREPLVGVTVYDADNPTVGTVTDIDGKYAIEFDSKKPIKLYFSYVGYDPETHVVSYVTPKVNVGLLPHNELLDDVVVTAGRFEQRQTDVTVSMELLKPQALRNQAPTDLSATLQTLPGIDVVDKQPSIRGGGGWTYSVGSRCLVLLDGMSILNPKTGEINWNNIPLENVGQVEVIKGASSVLYGSSALNGIINVRTQRPGLKPETKLSIYTGIYDNYKNYYHTGSRLPLYVGAEASHSRRVDNFDITAAINLFKDEGYRQQSFNDRLRFGGGFTYHHPVPDGKYMNMGAKANYVGSQYGDFFIWRSPVQPIKSSPLTNMGRKEHNFNIDPFFNYDDTDKGISHKVRARFALASDNLTRPTEAPSLTDIAGNLLPKINWAALTDEQQLGYINLMNLLTTQSNWLDINKVLGDVLPLKTYYDNDDWIGLINAGKEWAQKVCPTATVNDLNDIIGCVMDLMSDKTATRPELTYNAYVDYQFSKAWKSGVRLTTGVTWNHLTNTANITGTHHTDNVSVYLQYDHRIADRLSLCLGGRLEYYRMDSSYNEANIQIGKWLCPVRPVLRAGLNWEIYKAGFLRASFGQGYRNPSITEKYARKDIGGVGVYPNHDLRAERGYSAEIGYKQLFKFGRWSGYLDASAFYMEYKDMIEYQFGLFDNSNFKMINSMADAKAMIDAMLSGTPGAGLGIGAQFVNVNRARIYGAEVSAAGKVDIQKEMVFNYMLGYTFTEPEDLDNSARVATEATYTDPLQMKNKSNDSKYLKYRNKHSFKATLDYQYKWFSIGMNMNYKSKMLAVDYLMVDERVKTEKDLMDYIRTIIFGYENGETLHSYWEKHNKDYFTMDIRLGARIRERWELQFMVNNLLNTEYSYRPMALAAPRSYVCRLNYTF